MTPSLNLTYFKKCLYGLLHPFYVRVAGGAIFRLLRTQFKGFFYCVKVVFGVKSYVFMIDPILGDVTWVLSRLVGC